MTEIEDDINQPAAVEKASVQARAGYTLFGEPLHTYSPSRKVAAQAMGFLYPYVGESGAAQMEQTGRYPGMLRDMVILLWLCSLPDPHELTKEQIRAGEWTASRALSQPLYAIEAAMEWAALVDILDASAKAVEAIQVFGNIASGALASEFKVEIESASSEGGGSPNV